MTHIDAIQFRLQPGTPIRGRVRVPGDKSISHRAVMLGGLAKGTSRVRGWLAAGDTEATLGAVRALGVSIDRVDRNTLLIHGGKLHQPESPLNFVNAGTGIRLMAGIMAGQPFESVLDGSAQLRRRPMRRVTAPLALMGANITTENDRAPLVFRPAQLTGIHYDMPVASGQVKSCVLLAGLFADGETVVTQPGPARDHTEVMLRSMGADIQAEGYTARITSKNTLSPLDITVPGDISSAAFLIVAAVSIPNSDLVIEHVNLNQTRTGILDVLLEMGANIAITQTGFEAGEPVGNIHVKYGALRGVEIGGETVVRMIDEFPALMVAALCSEGQTIVRDAKELRVKETDRLAVMTQELTQMGAIIQETADGFMIDGPQKLRGAVVEGHDDHRIAMSLTVAGLVADGEVIVRDAKCAGDSFPGFSDAVKQLGGEIIAEPEAQ